MAPVLEVDLRTVYRTQAERWALTANSIEPETVLWSVNASAS